MKKEEILKDIVWGNRLFVNAQFIVAFISHITHYLAEKERLETVFAYAKAVNTQQKTKLYYELKREIEEVCLLETEIREGRISVKDKQLIRFVLNNILIVFTQNIGRN